MVLFTDAPDTSKKGLLVFTAKVKRGYPESRATAKRTDVLFEDPYVRLSRYVLTINRREMTFRYDLEVKHHGRSIPVHGDIWWKAIFMRTDRTEVPRETYSVVYADSFVSLIRYGEVDCDYVFICIQAPREVKKGDPRFSTVVDAHSIEKER